KKLPNRPFAYAVLPLLTIEDDMGSLFVDWFTMDYACSHELAEAVTDPQEALGALGWLDTNNGEVADIVISLGGGEPPRLNIHGALDILVGPDGSFYIVQKIWSIRDNAPVAFAHQTSAPDSSSINLTYHGGPLIQNARVATLFWGTLWSS